MRELQVCPSPKRGTPGEVVRRLEFRAGGTELVAWVGYEEMTADGRTGSTYALHACDLGSGAARPFVAEHITQWLDWSERTPDPLLTPDGSLLVYEAGEYGDDNAVHFEETGSPPGEGEFYPSLPTCPHGLGGFALTADGATLFAVRHTQARGALASDVARFEMVALFQPPVRVEERVNPLTRQPYQARIYDLGWKRLLRLPADDRYTVAALSADERFLAVGSGWGQLLVADLKRRKVVQSFPWEGRKLRDRAAERVAFRPDGKQVATLANGRLFAHPLGAGKAWQTKATLGYAHDFAFHPSGHTLCAVFRGGHARDFDTHTGEVRRAFRWAKKPQPLYSVCFAPDGLTCAAGGANGRVVVWDVDA